MRHSKQHIVDYGIPLLTNPELPILERLTWWSKRYTSIPWLITLELNDVEVGKKIRIYTEIRIVIWDHEINTSVRSKFRFGWQSLILS